MLKRLRSTTTSPGRRPSPSLLRYGQNSPVISSTQAKIIAKRTIIANLDAVMPGHSRPKDGVASLAYVPGIPFRDAPCPPDRDGRDEPSHDDVLIQCAWNLL